MTNMIDAPTWERVVRLAEKGGYPNATSLLHEMLDRQEQIEDDWEDIIQNVREGMDDHANGRSRSNEEVFRDLTARHGIS